MKYFRNCPRCGEDVSHTSAKERNRATKLKRVCKSCAKTTSNLKSGANPFKRRNRQKLRELQRLLRSQQRSKGGARANLDAILDMFLASSPRDVLDYLKWCEHRARGAKS